MKNKTVRKPSTGEWIGGIEDFEPDPDDFGEHIISTDQLEDEHDYNEGGPGIPDDEDDEEDEDEAVQARDSACVACECGDCTTHEERGSECLSG